MNRPLIFRSESEIIAHGSEGPVTVGALLAEAVALAERLPGARYAINLHSNRLDYLRAFCAAMLAGQCTLMPPTRSAGTLLELEQRYPDSYRIGGDPGEPSLSTDHAGEARHGAVTPSGSQISEDHEAIIAFTSGSTGQSTATAKSWHNLCAATRNNYLSLVGERDSPVHLLATVPPQHMWGFEMSVLLPMMAPVAISRRSPLYPADVADALSALPGPRMLVSSPLHLRALMASQVTFPALSRIYTATAPLDAGEARALEQHFQTEVLDVFGCSESGIIARKRTATEAEWRLTPPFTLQPAESGTYICAAHLPEDVLLPDVVELRGKNRFKWIGRNKDMVNIAGKRGSLADLTARLLRVEGVADGVVFQPEGESRLAALVVAPGTARSEVVAGLKAEVDPAFIPRPLYLVESLPRLETGKLAQADLLALFDKLRKRHGAIPPDPNVNDPEFE